MGNGDGLDLKREFGVPSHQLNDNDAMMYICKYLVCMNDMYNQSISSLFVVSARCPLDLMCSKEQSTPH